MNMNILSKKTWIATLCVAGVLGAAIWALPSRAADPAAPAAVKPALTVTLSQASPGQLPMGVTANGNVAAWQEAIIGAEVGGLRLAELRAQVGDAVKRGQVLAVFAAESVNADVALAQASVMEATASAQDAKANADRARTLQGTGALSAQQMAQFLTAEQATAARLDMAKAQLAAQSIRQKNTQVLAPDDGLISARSATVGAVVGTGTELFRLIRQGRLEWRAEVTASEVGQLKVGAKAKLTATSGVQAEGRVRQIAPSVDPQTRAVLVYVDFPAKAGIKAGMFAKGEFETGTSAALTLPQQAVVLRDGFSYVMVVQKPAASAAPAASGASAATATATATPSPAAGASGLVRVAQVKVVTGRRVGTAVEIVSGLPAGAQVVNSGAAFLADGDWVKVVTK
jgi:HlyD family secretion protein